MKKKSRNTSGYIRITVILLCFHFFCEATAQPSKLDSAFIRTLKQALESGNIQKLSPLLSAEFTLGVYHQPASGRILESVLSQYRIDSVLVDRIEAENGMRRLVMKVYKSTDHFFSNVYLNGENRILYFDLFDQLYGVDRYGRSMLKATIPFEEDHGSIIVKARVSDSDRELRFLFDTGADGMALRKSLADSLGLVVSRKQSASVVGGTMEIAVSSGNSFHFDSLTILNNSIALFDGIGNGYDGIIGCTIAARYIVRVDFDSEVIELYSFGVHEFDESGFFVDASFSTGVPVLPLTLTVGSKTVEGEFVFDSGAKYYLIGFGPFVKENLLLTNGFVPSFTGSTVSMGKSTTSFTGNFSEMSFGEFVIKDFPGTLQETSLRDKNWDVPADGSLGIDVIKRFNFTLDRSQQKIHFVSNRSYNLPVDFFIGELLLAATDAGTLRIVRIAGDSFSDKIFEGDIILAINGISSETLIRHPEKIEKLQRRSNKRYKISLKRGGETISVEVEN